MLSAIFVLGLCIEHLTVIINTVASVFVTASHFHPNIIFKSTARGSTNIRLGRKWLTVADSGFRYYNIHCQYKILWFRSLSFMTMFFWLFSTSLEPSIMVSCSTSVLLMMAMTTFDISWC
jgi:hypothetical protein